MDAKTVQVFVTAVDQVLSTLGGVHVVFKGQVAKHRGTPLGDVTGVIDMSTSLQAGSMALSFSKPLALAMSEKVLMHSAKKIDAEVQNLVGEVTNMVCGGAKHPLHEAGIDIGFASPVVLTGRRKKVPHTNQREATVLTLETSEGPLYVELSLDYQLAA
ncbi:MAG: chemotaxis protein CheX [Gammaproteobacteria bacterium]|nr:chemotaxis protein CheX [Gammaproteobacteria bacterium]